MCDLPALFHGTSSQFLPQILIKGIGCESEVQISRSEIDQILTSYELIKWKGLHGGGFSVLSTFSVFDFNQAELKPVYLPQTSKRAQTYASKDFAGGECARAVRYAIEDLRKYIDNYSIREEAFYQNIRDEKPWIDEYSEFFEDNTNSIYLLKNELKLLSPLEKKASYFFENHQEGIILTIEIEKEDLPFMKYNSSMGIQFFGTILPNRIKDVTPIKSENATQSLWEMTDDDSLDKSIFWSRILS